MAEDVKAGPPRPRSPGRPVLPGGVRSV